MDICQNDCEECYDQRIINQIRTIQRIQILFKIIYLKLKKLILFKFIYKFFTNVIQLEFYKIWLILSLYNIILLVPCDKVLLFYFHRNHYHVVQCYGICLSNNKSK